MIPESKSKIIFEELPEDDPKIRQPDITLAQSLFGWEPKVQRSEGLKRTLKYFNKAILLEDRAKNGSKEHFRKVLDSVPDVEPEEFDRL
jgi:hypothetical protein